MATYRLFPSTDGPSKPASYGDNPIVVGVQFQVNTGGCWLDGYWWWVCPSEQPTEAQTFALWQAYTDVGEGNLIASATVTSGTLKAGEWNFVELAAAVPLSIGATYIAATGLTGDFPTTNSQFGGGGPYKAGITQGPLFAYSDIAANGGSAPAPTQLQQAVYSTAGSDPTKYMPGEGSNSQNLWVDIQINTNAPAGASYRLWPSYPIIAGGVSQDPEPQSFGTEFKLSQACTLNKLWFYSPPSVTQLPTACRIYEISTQAIVAGTDNESPAWSGAAGSGWVACDYTGVTLPAGDYKATIYYGGSELFYQENVHYFSTPQSSVEAVAKSLTPVAWWELADAAGSKTAADSSGNGYAGTVIGGVTFGEAGPLEGGTTATVNGTSGYLSTGLNFSTWTKLSFAAFVLIPSGTTQVCGLVGSNNAAADGGAYLQLLDSSGSLALQFNVGTASASFVSSASWADGKWHHVAVSWDGSTAIGYLDGVQIGTSGTALTASVTAGSADVTVGAAGGDFFAGGLAHVLITNWALATASSGTDEDDDGVEPADAVDGLYWPSQFTTGPGWNGITTGPLSAPNILESGPVIGNWTNLPMTGNSSYSNPNPEFIYPDLYDVKDDGENRWVDVEVTPAPVIVHAHSGALLAVFP